MSGKDDRRSSDKVKRRSRSSSPRRSSGEAGRGSSSSDKTGQAAPKKQVHKEGKKDEAKPKQDKKKQQRSAPARKKDASEDSDSYSSAEEKDVVVSQKMLRGWLAEAAEEGARRVLDEFEWPQGEEQAEDGYGDDDHQGEHRGYSRAGLSCEVSAEPNGAHGQVVWQEAPPWESRHHVGGFHHMPKEKGGGRAKGRGRGKGVGKRHKGGAPGGRGFRRVQLQAR